MLLCMRTTITIPDEVLISAKRKALERRTTLGGFVTDAIRTAICRSGLHNTAKPKNLPTFRGTGVLPGVHLDSTVELLDRMEGRR